MTLIKKTLGVTVLSAVLMSSALSADNTKVGVGYSGVYYGNYIQGISARGWIDAIGVEAIIGNFKMDNVNSNFYSAKAMYAPIIHDHSKFYIGLEGGIATSSDSESNIKMIRPFFGSEYSFQEIPELGFSWEAGYMRSTVDGNNALSGTTVSIGMHYYF